MEADFLRTVGVVRVHGRVWDLENIVPECCQLGLQPFLQG